MDLLSEIIRLNHNTSATLRRQYYDQLNQLNLMTRCAQSTEEEFLTLLQDSQVMGVIKDFLASVLCQSDIVELAQSLLMAYHFSKYSDKYTDPHDQKMVQSAQKLIDELTRQHERERLIKIIDTYFAHYSIWNTKNQYTQIEDRFEMIQKYLHSYQHSDQLQENPQPLLDVLMPIYHEIQKNHPLFLIEKFLQQYARLQGLHQVTDLLWQDINEYYLQSPDHCLIILCIELRFNLLNLVKNPESKRLLFYEVDPESLISMAQKGTFTTEEVDQILKTLHEIMLKEGFQITSRPGDHHSVIQQFQESFEALGSR